jgi:hypothetical protein
MAQEFRKDLQGTVDDKLFNRKEIIKKPNKWIRCGVCHKESERVFPLLFNVTDETFQKIIQLSKESGARFELVKREHIRYPLVYKVDDFTCRPINGMCNQISIDCCPECLDKIGRRHKFDHTTEKKKFITSRV